MLILIRDSDYEMVKLEEDKEYKFNDFTKKITKGSTIWNCDDELMAKILFMQSKIDQAYKSGVISLSQIVLVVGRVFGEVEVINDK